MMGQVVSEEQLAILETVDFTKYRAFLTADGRVYIMGKEIYYAK
jgi:hypothetical protein